MVTKYAKLTRIDQPPWVGQNCQRTKYLRTFEVFKWWAGGPRSDRSWTYDIHHDEHERWICRLMHQNVIHRKWSQWKCGLPTWKSYAVCIGYTIPMKHEVLIKNKAMKLQLAAPRERSRLPSLLHLPPSLNKGGSQWGVKTKEAWRCEKYVLEVWKGWVKWRKCKYWLLLAKRGVVGSAKVRQVQTCPLWSHEWIHTHI